MAFPTEAFVNGAFRPALAGKTFETVNPATGQVLAKVAACDAADLPETINCLIWHAELIDKIHDLAAPASDNHIALILREPVGVVGLVLPWIFPLLMLAWKIGPAHGYRGGVLYRIDREWPMGDPPDPENRIGALVSPAHFDKVRAYLGKGTTVLLGGKAASGFVEPTILEVDRGAKLAREEIFGPVLSVLTVGSFDEAIALANDTEYSLAASIWPMRRTWRPDDELPGAARAGPPRAGGLVCHLAGAARPDLAGQ